MQVNAKAFEGLLQVKDLCNKATLSQEKGCQKASTVYMFIGLTREQCNKEVESNSVSELTYAVAIGIYIRVLPRSDISNQGLTTRERARAHEEQGSARLGASARYV